MDHPLWLQACQPIAKDSRGLGKAHGVLAQVGQRLRRIPFELQEIHRRPLPRMRKGWRWRLTWRLSRPQPARRRRRPAPLIMWERGHSIQGTCRVLRCKPNYLWTTGTSVHRCFGMARSTRTTHFWGTPRSLTSGGEGEIGVGRPAAGAARRRRVRGPSACSMREQGHSILGTCRVVPSMRNNLWTIGSSIHNCFGLAGTTAQPLGLTRPRPLPRRGAASPA